MALPDLSEYDKQAAQKKFNSPGKLGWGTVAAVMSVCVLVAVVLFLYIQSPSFGGLEGTWKLESAWRSTGFSQSGEGSVTLKLEQDGAYELTLTPCVVSCPWCRGEWADPAWDREGLRQLLKLPAMSPEQEAYERSLCELRHLAAATSPGGLIAVSGAPMQPTYVGTGKYEIRDGKVRLYQPGGLMDEGIPHEIWTLNYDSRGYNDDYLHSPKLRSREGEFSLRKQ